MDSGTTSAAAQGTSGNLRVYVDSALSGEQLAEVTVALGATVLQLRLAAEQHSNDSLQLVLDSKPLLDGNTLDTYGICDGGHVLAIRRQRMPVGTYERMDSWYVEEDLDIGGGGSSMETCKYTLVIDSDQTFTLSLQNKWAGHTQRCSCCGCIKEVDGEFRFEFDEEMRMFSERQKVSEYVSIKCRAGELPLITDTYDRFSSSDRRESQKRVENLPMNVATSVVAASEKLVDVEAESAGACPPIAYEQPVTRSGRSLPPMAARYYDY